MNLFKQPRSTTDPQQIQYLKTWTSEILELPETVPVSISQLQCHEPECPPVETVIAVMQQPTQIFKVHAAPSDITRDQLRQCLTKNVHL
jgi:hypothetical protein